MTRKLQAESSAVTGRESCNNWRMILADSIALSRIIVQ